MEFLIMAVSAANQRNQLMSQTIALLKNDQTFVSSLSDGLKNEGLRADTYVGEASLGRRHQYPVRTVAKIFSYVGLVTLFYATAVTALALQSAIVEF
jgi:hypothetical protein